MNRPIRYCAGYSRKVASDPRVCRVRGCRRAVLAGAVGVAVMSATKAEKRRAKAAYDLAYRTKNAARLKREKKERNARVYTYEYGLAQRNRRKELHGENVHTRYCRRYYKNPVRKAEKVVYDESRRGRLCYAEYAAAWSLWKLLDRTIKRMYPSDYERRKARGYYLLGRTTQERKRNAQISRW